METVSRAASKEGPVEVPAGASVEGSLLRNAACNVAGECLWGLQANMVYASTVLVVALRHFGASTQMIGSIAAIEQGANTLPQLLGMHLFRSRKHRKWQLIWWHAGAMIPALPVMGAIIFLSSSMPPAVARWLLLVTFAWYAVSIGAIMSVWWDWIARLLPAKVRGRVMGLSFAGAAGTGVLGAAAASWVIAAMGEPQAFGVLYVAAGVIAWASMLAFMLTRDPVMEEPEERQPGVREQVGRFWTILADGELRRLLVGRSLAVLGFGITPLIADYYLEHGVAKEVVVGSVVATTIAAAGTHFVVGWLGDHAGFRWGMLLGIAAQIATLAVVLAVPSAGGCMIAFAGVGAAGSAGFMAHTNLMIDTCRDGNRVAHLTAGSLALSPWVIGGPLVAGLAARYAGYRPVFAACLCVSVLALAWAAARVGEPRRGKAV